MKYLGMRERQEGWYKRAFHTVEFDERDLTIALGEGWRSDSTGALLIARLERCFNLERQAIASAVANFSTLTAVRNALTNAEEMLEKFEKIAPVEEALKGETT